MELVMIFAIVLLLLLGFMVFLALGFYRAYRYPPNVNQPNVPLMPPPLPSERPRDANWRGV